MMSGKYLASIIGFLLVAISYASPIPEEAITTTIENVSEEREIQKNEANEVETEVLDSEEEEEEGLYNIPIIVYFFDLWSYLSNDEMQKISQATLEEILQGDLEGNSQENLEGNSQENPE